MSEGKNLIHNVQHLIKGVICVSEWQRNNVMTVYDLPELNYHIIPIPIDTTFYKKDIHIITNSFIYMQSPDRGLELLLDCLLELQVHIPNISLTVFRKNEFTESIHYKLGKLNHTTIYGKVSQDELAGHCMRAEYFFYPTAFNETFCCCAAEAQLYNTVCIYGATGALTTTIGDRGLPILYSINSPDYVTLVTKDLIEAHKSCEKLMPILHLPVQSGSSKILGAMNRKHNITEYYKIIEDFKKAKPDIKFSSDFIIGYPGETEDDFSQTLSLIEKVKFINSYSFVYSPRPGTPASKLDDVDSEVAKKRLIKLQSILEKNNSKYKEEFLDKSIEVLFENKLKKQNKYFGRDRFLNSVIVESEKDLNGKILDVKINSFNHNSLSGIVLSNKKNFLRLH